VLAITLGENGKLTGDVIKGEVKRGMPGCLICPMGLFNNVKVYMPQTLTTLLIFMPLILGVLASLATMRIVSRRVLFFFAATLTMLGLQSIIAPAAFSLLIPFSIYGTEGFELLTHGLLVAVVLQLIVGTPFLWWLAQGLRKP
jgi:hypothetical protein